MTDKEMIMYFFIIGNSTCLIHKDYCYTNGISKESHQSYIPALNDHIPRFLQLMEDVHSLYQFSY
jgi:hypothetical protein